MESSVKFPQSRMRDEQPTEPLVKLSFQLFFKTAQILCYGAVVFCL
jgi:hypothetical protein